MSLVVPMSRPQPGTCFLVQGCGAYHDVVRGKLALELAKALPKAALSGPYDTGVRGSMPCVDLA